MAFQGLILAAEDGGHEVINPLLPAVPDLLWGTVVFVVLVIFVSWYVMPRINRALDARAEAIQGGIAKAEEAQAEAAAALAQYRAQLAEGRAEAAAIREQARADGQKILAELKGQAQEEAARIVANAHTQIEAERAAALVSLRSEVGTLALDLAGGVIGERLADDKIAGAVVDRFLKDLEASK